MNQGSIMKEMRSHKNGKMGGLWHSYVRCAKDIDSEGKQNSPRRPGKESQVRGKE